VVEYCSAVLNWRVMRGAPEDMAGKIRTILEDSQR
jgi:hypothetical protein